VNSHTATVLLVTDERGDRAVVQQADDVIWIADELMEQARDPDRPRITGDIEIDGDLITFGTPGEGLGRLTYRLTGYDRANGWHIAERIATERA